MAWHHKAKTLQSSEIETNTTDVNNSSSRDPLDPNTYLSENEELPWNEKILEFCETRFEGFTEIAIPAFAVSYLFFFGIGGFLHVSIIFVL